MNGQRLKILLIEDDEKDYLVMREFLSRIEDGAFELEWAPSYEAGLAAMTSSTFDVYLIDYCLGKRTGLDLLREVQANHWPAPAILLTPEAEKDRAVDVEAMKSGAADYLIKNQLTADLLERSIRYAIERKRIERALRESELRYRTFIEQSSEGVFCFEIERPISTDSPENERMETFWRYGYLAECNEALARSIGYAHPEEIIGLRAAALTDPTVAANSEVARGFARSGYRMADAESREVDKNGNARYYLNNLVGIVENGCLVRVWGTRRDVTEQKKAEAALRQSEEQFRLLFESNPQPMWVYDLQTLFFRAVNDAAISHYGYSREEFLCMTIADIRPIEEVPAMVESILNVRHGLSPPGEWRHQKKDGTLIDADVSAHGLTFDGSPARIVLATDVTERKRAEEALRQTKDRYRSIIHNAVYGIYLSAKDGSFVEVNPALVSMLGYDSAEELTSGNRSNDLYRDANERDSLIAQYGETGRIDGVEAGWKKKDGTPITVRLSGHAVKDERGEFEGFEMMVEDVTRRRLLEEQLRQSQKMEAVGRLAGGVAHDFNNLLTAINGYAELLMMSLGKDDRHRQTLGEIRRAGDRAAALTNQLLAFSRRQVLQPKVIDLNAVISQSSEMIGRLIGEDIELITATSANPRFVKADPTQIEQVLLNLAVNARDAMPRGGKLIVETANACLDEDYALHHIGVRAGRYVMLAVSDTGCGIPDETRAHIFEPFYTTKEEGRGTGLGLSTVYGVVEQSGGHISFRSEVGRGTTFEVYLPEVATPPEAGLTPSNHAVRSPRGSETILLVEDEEMVRQLARDILELNGYRVLEAAGSDEALRYCEHSQPIHLMVTDVVMPVMSGRELAERIMPCHPEMKVLYISGYTDDAIVHHGVSEGSSAFMQKPFTPDGFADRVREVLDQCQ